VSSKCAKLEDDINDLFAEDPAFVRAINVLKHIQSLNKQQGLGFVCGGQVVTKRTLWVLCTAIYSTLAVVMPTIEGELGLSPSCYSGAQHASCDFGWTFAGNACFKLFGDGVLGEPLGWTEAEEACQAMGLQTHLASVTSEEQQHVLVRISSRTVQDGVWIGLNNVDGPEFVWTDEEFVDFTSWGTGEPIAPGQGHVGAMYRNNGWRWGDGAPLTTKHPYICATTATPIEASGGFMRGCENGHWVMGTPYKHAGASIHLPATIVYGVYPAKIYDQIRPTKIELNETVTTPAACATLVQRDYADATAAEYSNIGGEWCMAVFEA
jgi:hypothetical protein